MSVVEGVRCPRCGREIRKRAHGFLICAGCSRPPNACDCDPLPPSDLEAFA